MLVLTPQSALSAWASIRSIFGLIPGGDGIIGAQIFGQAEIPLVDAISLESLKMAIKNDAENIDDKVCKLINCTRLIIILRHKTLNRMFMTSMGLVQRSKTDNNVSNLDKLMRLILDFLHTIFYYSTNSIVIRL